MFTAMNGQMKTLTPAAPGAATPPSEAQDRRGMDRRSFLRNSAALTAGLAAAGCRSLQHRAGTKQPNLLFIITDQQRHDALGCAGNPHLETPNLDRLALEGVLFRRAYTQCPVCAPARTSVLTGQTIEHTGVLTNDLAYVAPDSGVCPMPTFDEILADRGYWCEYHGKWHSPIHRINCYRNVEYTVNPRNHHYALAHFQRYHQLLDEHVPRRDLRPGEQASPDFGGRPYTVDPLDRLYGRAPGDVPAELRTLGNRRRPQPAFHGRLEIPAQYSLTAYQAGCAIDAIERAAAQNAPFSITCSIVFPHSPILPTAPYYGMYPPEQMTPPVSIDDPMANSPYADANGRRHIPEYADPDKIRYMISNYYGLVREIDDWVGKILDKLAETGADRNTLVVFTSDHGEMLGAHGMREKNVFFEESARVPLILRLPSGRNAGTVVDTAVSQLDLFATILDYLGAGHEPSDGTSLRPVIEGGQAATTAVVSEWDWHGDSQPNFMVCDGRWKFYCPYTAESHTLNVLCDLESDPHELVNLIGLNPERERWEAQAEHMKRLLVAWLEAHGSRHTEGVRARPVLDPRIPPPGVERIFARLTHTPTEYGLLFERESTVTTNKPVSVAGREAWQTQRAKPGNNFRYVFFTVNAPDFREGRAPRCRIEIEYLDSGTGTVEIVYDSSDLDFHLGGPTVPGAWKPAGRIQRTDSGVWREQAFTVTDARFAGNCNGRDLRVNVLDDQELAIASLTITRDQAP
jgi:arylsulfatase A-like enzyme